MARSVPQMALNSSTTRITGVFAIAVFASQLLVAQARPAHMSVKRAFETAGNLAVFQRGRGSLLQSDSRKAFRGAGSVHTDYDSMGLVRPGPPSVSYNTMNALLDKEGLGLSLIETRSGTALHVKHTAASTRKPNVTAYPDLLSACRACIEFFPAKEDGLKFHAAMHHDTWGGGTWPGTCHAGPCTTRGDIIVVGSSVESNEESFCITQVPVPWFSECEPVLQAAMTNVYDLSRFCSYREQIFVPPPAHELSAFVGVTQAFTRLDNTQETCLDTINTQGTRLWDDMNFCDTDLHTLSGCCESVHDSLKCTYEVGGSAPAFILQQDQQGWDQLKASSGVATGLFDEFCVPLCVNSYEEFCEKYPYADICVQYRECAPCTRSGGFWCAETGECQCPLGSAALIGRPDPQCPSEPIKSTLQCLASTTPAPPAPPALRPRAPPAPAPPPPLPPAMQCKYLEMVDVWSQDMGR